jgi:undecaprenyl-diphosphatase
MLTPIKAIILGVIQGITEWLPVSSSGHLVLAQHLLKVEVPVAFDVWLHTASLFIILIFFRGDLVGILKSLLAYRRETYGFRLAIFIIVGSTATASVVLPLKDLFERAFSNLLAVSVAFLFTGTLLFFSGKNRKERELAGHSAAIIGLFQGLAFLPGLSRSGSTIAGALLLGIKRQDAFKFSFILLIPAIIATSIFRIRELALAQISATSLAWGFIAAMATGFLCLGILKRAVIKGKLHYFAYYCWFIGILSLISSFVV